MLSRRRLLEMGYSSPKTKILACAFESGVNGVTSRLRRFGQDAIIVDKEGRGFSVDQWPTSETFRLGSQRGLLLGDNQTENYEKSSAALRVTFQRMTWGDYIAAPPSDFPDIGLRFPVDAQLTSRFPVS